MNCAIEIMLKQYLVEIIQMKLVMLVYNSCLKMVPKQ
jgi:hypothetical protein